MLALLGTLDRNVRHVTALLLPMIIGPITRTVRSRRSVFFLALIAVAPPTLVTAAGASDGAPRIGLGLSSIHLVGAARIADGFGTVTSGYRSITHNRRVGGVPTSYHLVGRAIDVERRRGVTHQTIATALQRAGYILVESLDERDHSHFAFASAPLFSAVGKAPKIVSAIPPGKLPGPRILAADDHGVLMAASPSLAFANKLSR